MKTNAWHYEKNVQVTVYMYCFRYLKSNQTTKKMGRNRNRFLTKSKGHDPIDVRKKKNGEIQRTVRLA